VDVRGHGGAQHSGEFGRGGGVLLARQVGHAEAPAQVELADADAVCAFHRAQEVHHPLGGGAERIQIKDLRSYVRVQPDQVQGWF
jgi:hypothetical protein